MVARLFRKARRPRKVSPVSLGWLDTLTVFTRSAAMASATSRPHPPFPTQPRPFPCRRRFVRPLQRRFTCRRPGGSRLPADPLPGKHPGVVQPCGCAGAKCDSRKIGCDTERIHIRRQHRYCDSHFPPDLLLNGNYLLTVIAAGITDSFGTVADGNADGIPAGDFDAFVLQTSRRRERRPSGRPGRFTGRNQRFGSPGVRIINGDTNDDHRVDFVDLVALGAELDGKSEQRP